MEKETKLLSEQEFAKLLEDEGIDAGKKYLNELVSQLPDDKVKELYFAMKEANDIYEKMKARGDME